ncbi:MAG TPA: universal stress protein [Thermoanaerobaculia bacterium]|nr:universal stress protein [Thermoanaerobaculia bacterium]
MKRIRNVLVATDFSPASRPAFRRALELATSNQAALWIAHVAPAPGPISPDGYVLPRIYDEMEQAIRADAQKRLRLLLARARKLGARGRALLLRGTPAEAIVRAARGHRADMIVLGTHGRTGMARFFVGSVAARVVAAASCPVLTVRGR